MSSEKSAKELAFVRDLYIAPDWGERFARLMDEHVDLPKKGRILYSGAGTGAHALSILEKAPKDVEIVCVEENAQCLEIFEAKTTVLRIAPILQQQQMDSLTFDDDEFDLVLTDASLIDVTRLPEVVEETLRVARPGAWIALNVATAASFGEIFSVFWEALMTSGIPGHDRAVEDLIVELPLISDLEEMLSKLGAEEVTSWTEREEFHFESSREFFDSPLVADFLMPYWMQSFVEPDERNQLKSEIARIIDEDRGDLDFMFTVRATVLVGRKPADD